MSKDQIIAMAREAGTPYVNRHAQGETHFGFNEESLQRFASLVAAQAAAEEREACAKVCDTWSAKHSADAGGCTYSDCDFVAAAQDCAAAIRGRSAK